MMGKNDKKNREIQPKKLKNKDMTDPSFRLSSIKLSTCNTNKFDDFFWFFFLIC